MDEADDTQQSTIDNYTGVAIKVCDRPCIGVIGA